MFKNFIKNRQLSKLINANNQKKTRVTKKHLNPIAAMSANMDMEPVYDRRRCWRSTSMDVPLIGQQQYKLLSYNILAQDLLVEHMQLYVGIDPNVLQWKKRCHNLQKEIKTLNPDVICLQEMQYDHLKEFVRMLRGKRQLEYIYKKKTGSRTDGCAIIFDRDKFQLLAEQAVEYHASGVETLNRENVALLAKFRLKDEPAKEVVIATTHLLYNPRRDDVRSAQIGVLHAALNFFAFNNGTQIPIILTGDFNLENDSCSFEILKQPTQLVGNNGQIKAIQELQPLYFGVETASTYQNRWITVDYILHAQGNEGRNVKIWSVYELPQVTDCQRFGYIPNHIFGSDHYSLAIKFSIN